MSDQLFNKHPETIVRERKPFNAEPPLTLLRESFITPTTLFYSRNHGDIPNIETKDFRLIVEGLVERALNLSLDDLQNDFAAHTITATLQCAGNRRNELVAHKSVPGEVFWSAQAVSNATWTGARLSDVLAHAKVKDTAQHAAFLGLDEEEKHGRQINFGGSIPIMKAMSDAVLLAYRMNDEPLLPVHGFPLRAVVPGYIGARSVKWLSRISLQAEPSDNYYQQHAYKLFPPEVTKETVDWTKGEMLNENFVTCVIAAPESRAKVAAGEIEVKGYAIGRDMNRIAQVEVSIDGGATWTPAETENESQQPGAWCLWRTQLNLNHGKHKITVRATDSAGNTQPRDVASVWNFKGYMNNAWHQVEIEVA